MRTILATLPRAARARLKPLIRQVCTAAMACLAQELEGCLVSLKLPKAHHKSIRTTNLRERPFGEGRRRTKVMPRFPTETAWVKLVFATLLTAAQRWRGWRVTPRILRELDAIRQEREPVLRPVA
jgi:putative transposase